MVAMGPACKKTSPNATEKVSESKGELGVLPHGEFKAIFVQYCPHKFATIMCPILMVAALGAVRQQLHHLVYVPPW